MTAASDPYEPDSTEGTYWHARHKLTAAARGVNEKVGGSDITPGRAAETTPPIEQITPPLGAAKKN